MKIKIPKFFEGDRVWIPKLPKWMEHFPQNCAATVARDRTEDGEDVGLIVDGHGYCAWYPVKLLSLLEPRKACPCCHQKIAKGVR